MKSNPLDTLSEIAVSRGGQLLSEQYPGSRAKLLWKCQCGHEWEAPGYSIKSGHWCPSCGEKRVGKKNRRYSLDDAIAYARSKGGQCISKEYFATESKLEWKCSEGHVWLQSFGVVKRHNIWCPYCHGMYRTIEDMTKWAAEKGGKCLSASYCNAKTKLEWECNDGHIWKATPDSIKCGSWCPYCVAFPNEEKCRFTLESLTGLKFSKTRTMIGKLELDGYNDHLRLAFEYNGKQHYEFCSYFHRQENSLEQIQNTDKLKITLCQEKGITLIVIPYWCAENEEQLLDFLKSQLPDTNHLPVLFAEFYRTKSVLSKLNKLAKTRGGKCLSKTYINARCKLKWQCSFGHIWDTPSDYIQQGSWCPFCAGKRRSDKFAKSS